MTSLLHTASFKFSTSIAGLGVSIVFAIFARFIVIWIEGGLNRFCDAVENQLRYTAPQYLAAESNEAAKQQLDQLKEINSDRYFSRFAEVLQEAMARALAPMTSSVGTAIRENTGAELIQMSETLNALDRTLGGMHNQLQSTGTDFAGQMTAAAENLSRLVQEAGTRLEGGAEQNRAALADVVAALRTTIETATTRLDAGIGQAASGASSKMEDAMGRVLERLDGQVQGLTGALSEFQASSSQNLTTVRDHVASAQSDAAAAIGAAGAEAARALQAGIGETIQRVVAEIERFETSMRAGATAYAGQASAITEATSQTRRAAESFSETAERVRGIATPLQQSGERLAQVSTQMSEAVTRSSAELDKAGAGNRELAASLDAQVKRLTETWESYRTQFDRVDQALAEAVRGLGEATEAQSGRLADYVQKVDAAVAGVLDRLNPAIQEIGGSATELAETLNELVKRTGGEAR